MASPIANKQCKVLPDGAQDFHFAGSELAGPQRHGNFGDAEVLFRGTNKNLNRADKAVFDKGDARNDWPAISPEDTGIGVELDGQHGAIEERTCATEHKAPGGNVLYAGVGMIRRGNGDICFLFFESFDEEVQVFGTIRAVGVDGADDVTTRVQETGTEGRAHTPILVVADDDAVRVVYKDTLQGVNCRIGAAVVDEDKLQWAVRPGALDDRQSFGEVSDAGFFVEDRDHD